MAAWLGCVHGNWSSCGEQRVAGVLGVVPSWWAAYDPHRGSFPCRGQGLPMPIPDASLPLILLLPPSDNI